MRHRALALSRRAAPVALVALAACYINDPLVYLPEDAGAGGAASDAGTGGAGGVAPDAPPCSSNAECDDTNPCTVDLCLPAGCTNDPAPAGTSCGSDDNPCAGIDTCDGNGACAKGTPPVLDDGDACTTDVCDPASGIVTHTPFAPCITAMSTTGAPEPRYNHTAVWSGSRMVVWGGSGKGFPAALGNGGRYDPMTNAWTPIATNGAPPPRHSHCAVWTGSKMIVWGGFGTTSFENTGGVYDPAADSWSPMTTAGAPSGRVKMACAWTGKELVIWGGTTGGVIGNGGRYDPATDSWKALPSSGAPTPRYGSSAVWTGSRVIVWGGNDLFDWHKDGTSYDPVADAWTGFTPFTGAPAAREQHTAIWTGSRMVIWGGFTGGPYLNTGGALDPAGAAWVDTSTTGAPSPRTEHTAVWTGTRMIVWGGCGMDSCTELYGDGGAWTPDASGGSWTTIAASANVAARRGATAVWTGTTALYWGGRTSKGETDTGGVLHP